MNGSTRSLEIALALIDEGYTVDMITATRIGQVDFPSKYMGITIHWVDTPYGNELGFYSRVKMFLVYAFYSSYYSLIKDYDLIYCSSTPLTIGIPALLARFFRKKKFVFEVRDCWPEIPIAMRVIERKWIILFLKRFAYWCYSNSSLIVALSIDMKYTILESYNISTDKVLVAENGSRSQNFVKDRNHDKALKKKYNLPNQCKIVIYPGALGRVNAAHYIAHLAEFFNEELCFLVIGSGSEKQKVRCVAESNLSLNKNLFILDPISKKDIFALINLSDFLISTVDDIPELSQNSANKFFDGLRSGKCVLINYGGWQQEFLESTESGIRLSRDLNVASTQLRTLLNDESRLEYLKRNAVKHSSRYETSNITKRIVNRINELL